MTSPTINFVSLLHDEAARLDIDPMDVEQLHGLRVSTTNAGKLDNQIDDAQVLDNPAVVERLRELYSELARKDHRTRDADLADQGVVKVVERDLAVGHVSRRRVGWFTFVQHPESERWSVVLLVANSAVNLTLPAPAGSQRGLSSWAQMVTWTWWWAKTARVARFVADSRMSRDPEVFAPINGSIKERPGAVYWWGAECIDPRKDDWRAIIGATNAATQAKSSKTDMLRGRAGKWGNSAWTEDPNCLPLGLRLPDTINEHGVTARSSLPTVDPTTAPLAQRMWEHLAQGWSPTAIAVDAAADGLRNGSNALVALQVAPLMTDEQLARARQLCDGLRDVEATVLREALDGARTPRTKSGKDTARKAACGAAKRVFQHLDFYRSGTQLKHFTNTLPGHVKVGQHNFTFVIDDPRLVPPDADPNYVYTVAEFEGAYPNHPLLQVRAEDPAAFERTCRVGFINAELTLPSPVELTDAEWGAAKANLPAGWLEKRRTGHRKEQTRPTAPLSQLLWVQDDRQYRIWQDHGAYEVLVGELGAPVKQATRVTRVLASQLHRLLGKWMTEYGSTLDVDGPLPVLHTHAPTLAAADPVAAAETEADRLQTMLDEETARYDGLVRDRGAVDAGTSRGKREHASLSAQIDQISDELDQLEADLADAQAALDTARTAPVKNPDAIDVPATDVDISTLVAVGARLLELAETDRTADIPEMSAAVAWLFDGGKLLRFEDGEGRDVHLTVRGIRVPGRDTVEVIDGTRLTLTDTTGRIRGKPIDPSLPTLRDEAARWTLRDGDGPGFRRLREWSHTFLVEELRDWLQDRHIAPGAAHALIDAALTSTSTLLPAGPVVYAWLTSGPTGTPVETAAGDPERWAAARAAAKTVDTETMVEPIITAYVTHGDKWPARSTGWTRRPLEPIRRLMTLLADQPHDRYARRDVAAALGMSTTDLRDLVQADSPLRPVGIDNANVWLQPCGRVDDGKPCPGRMTVVVAVPETMLLGTHDGGLVACDVCHRLAGGYWTDRPLSRVHRKRWDAPAPRVSLHDETARSRIVDTPAQGSVRLPERRYSMATAARRLRIGHASVRRLIDDGVLRAVANRDKRGGYTIPAHELDRDEVIAAADALRERRYPPPEDKAA